MNEDSVHPSLSPKQALRQAELARVAEVESNKQKVLAFLREQKMLGDILSDIDEGSRNRIMVRMYGQLPGAVEPRWTVHNSRKLTHLGLNRSERRLNAKNNGKLGITRAGCRRDQRRISRRMRRAHKLAARMAALGARGGGNPQRHLVFDHGGAPPPERHGKPNIAGFTRAGKAVFR